MKRFLTIIPSRAEAMGGWIYLAIQMLVLPYALQLVNLLLGMPMSAAVLNFWYFLINFAAICFIFRKFLRKSVTVAKLRMGWTLQSAFLGYLVYQAGTTALGALFLNLYPGFANVNDGSIADLLEQNYVLMTIGTVFLVPVAEECLFRGMLFGGLYKRSRLIAYTVSACLFSAIHVVGYIGHYEPMLLILCFLQYIPAGIGLGWAFARSGSIAAPILIHMSINAMGIYMLR